VQFSAEDVGIADAVARAQVIDVEAGLRLRVATASELVILKRAAAEEPHRRSSRRQQDGIRRPRGTTPAHVRSAPSHPTPRSLATVSSFCGRARE
jgi:hypothetical protein